MRVSSPVEPVKEAPLIALTTDFGLDDPYSGILKGVIQGLCPNARIVDVTHGVPPQDVLAGVSRWKQPGRTSRRAPSTWASWIRG